MRQQDKYIDTSAVSERQKGNTTLSYIEGHRVIQNLNELYPGDWNFEIVKFEHIYCKDIVNTKTNKQGFEVGASCIGRLSVGKVASTRTYQEFTDIGYGSGTDYNNAISAYESAGKEAVTDSLKRCAKNIGNYFGLALYDKTQEAILAENVDGWLKLTSLAKTNVSSSLLQQMNDVRVAIKKKYNIEKAEDMTPAIWRELLQECWPMYWDSFVGKKSNI